MTTIEPRTASLAVFAIFSLFSLAPRPALADDRADAFQAFQAGLARVDRAVAQLGPAHDGHGLNCMPARLETYLVAASTYLGVPDDVFHRHEDAKSVLSKALAHPALARMSPGLRTRFARLEAQVARAEKRHQDELAALKRAASLDPTCPDGVAVQARIDELSR